MRVYLARKMTGLTAREIVEKSQAAAYRARQLFGAQIEILDPVSEEKVVPSDEVVCAPPHLLGKYWARDKEMIRSAHVVIDMTAVEKSEGTAHEIGYARYCLWKPVVRVYPELEGKPSVARLEDDVIVTSFDDALVVSLIQWGSAARRIVWRLRMLNRSLIRWLVWQIQEFK